MENCPHALLLTFPGTNCERETARALEAVGFSTVCVPFAEMTEDKLNGVDLLVFSGGFSYGDYIMSGRLATLELESKLGPALQRFKEQGGYMLGICNGFQILTKLGLLPEGSLIDNTSGRFICKWVTLENKNPENPFLRKLPATFEFPIAHAEGRFVNTIEKAEEYIQKGYGVLTYAEYVNGSSAQIAGLADPTGRIFGLMPHPERFIYKEQHYDADWNEDADWGWGYYFFQSIYEEISATSPVAV